ncbi:MAG: asparagine synthase B, partial [Chloroflexota bacterium]
THGSTTSLTEDDLSTLFHRGPDGNGFRNIYGTTLGHTRLAIIDVEGGEQPLSSDDGTVWLVVNGEIYNHLELRQRFPDYDFKTDSDSEVILPLWAKYGTKTAEMLDGMFALALVDESGQFYMARDPIGIKPLYYGFDGDTIHFSSEIKALKDTVEEVLDFPPGHWYTPEHGLVKYYDVADAAQSYLESIPSLSDIRESLVKAVKKRLMSDVPLGTYLSGGLDSTIVTAIAKQEMPHLHTFSVGVEGSEDIKNAREAAEALGTDHHEYIYTQEEMMEALPAIIYYLESYDPALVRSAIPNYFLARMTRQYVTVVLTGEGADELYAGYHYLKEHNTDEELTDELVTLTSTLYNCNLQRCDRMTMAHSIEGRVPFLDTEFIELSFAVAREMKISPDGVEKWALRKAFEDILPKNVAWRVKEQFSKGAGSSDMLRELADREISDDDFAAEADDVFAQTGYRIRSKEELLYHREFVVHFGMAATKVVEPWRGRDVT